jgi:hypothetical protein
MDHALIINTKKRILKAITKNVKCYGDQGPSICPGLAYSKILIVTFRLVYGSNYLSTKP